MIYWGDVMNDSQKGKLALLIGTTDRACDLYAAIVDLIENDIESENKELERKLALSNSQFDRLYDLYTKELRLKQLGGYTPTEPRQLTIDDLPKHDNGAGFYARNRPKPPMEGM